MISVLSMENETLNIHEYGDHEGLDADRYSMLHSVRFPMRVSSDNEKKAVLLVLKKGVKKCHGGTHSERGRR